MQTTAVMVAAVLALAAPSEAESERRGIRVSNCVLSLIDDIQVPAQAAGPLMELQVDEGALVEKGDRLATIDDRDARVQVEAAEAALKVAQLEADSDASVEVAEKAIGVTEAEYNSSKAINERRAGAVARHELERMRFQVERAVAQHLLAIMEKETAGLTAEVEAAKLRSAQNELERRQILAPISGVVADIGRRSGEWVQPGDSVLRLVRMDRLRVKGRLSAQQFSPDDVIGRDVTVRVPLTGGKVHEVRSKISYVDPRVEATGEYRVWAEVENELIEDINYWRLRPGLDAEMLIHLDQDSDVVAR